MPCYYPLQAWRGPVLKSGKRSIVFKPTESTGGLFSLKLPCGQCLGCKLDRSRSWAARCVCEAQMHEQSCFVTLTYDDVHLPKDGELHVEDWQRFCKRLRKSFGKFRYFHAGEYGSKGRPHYHALLFGYRPGDLVPFSRSEAGSDVFISKALSSVWQNGYCLVGDVTFESAAYVARYCVKKLEGDVLDKRFEEAGKKLDVVKSNGVIRKPEYVTMSRGRKRGEGIGGTWLTKYLSDVYPSGSLVLRGGVKMSPPRYFDGLFADKFPLDMERIKLHRVAMSDRKEEVFSDVLQKVQTLPVNRQDRLVVMEEVKQAQLRMCRRDQVD